MTTNPELAADAAEALRWVTRLRLTSSEWSYADHAMAMLDEALTSDDDAVREAVFDLDQLSPRVKEKLGRDSETDTVPPRIRDRANELIHRLSPDLDPHEDNESGAERDT